MANVSLLCLFKANVAKAYLSHGHPPNAFVLVYMLDNALVHQQDVWSTRYIRVNGHRKNEFICMLFS